MRAVQRDVQPGLYNRDTFPVHIRWMIRRDMPEVLDIEQASFEFYWSEEEFLRTLSQRNCIGMIAEHGERVVGFMIYEVNTNHLSLANLAVHPAYRRMLVGAAMVSRMLDKLSSHRRTHLVADIRESNLAAQKFFQEQGFRATEVLRNFYEDSGEDAYRMKRWVNGLEE